jgi:hypothetical protein
MLLRHAVEHRSAVRLVLGGRDPQDVAELVSLGLPHYWPHLR